MKGISNKIRLMSKTVVNGRCLEFSGGIGSTGYGVFWMDGRNQNAHRASYILNKGSIPVGKWVLHKCDNKKCIKPSHLYLGTLLDNVRDAVIRGCMAKGVRHGSKTKPESVKARTIKLQHFSNKECSDIYQMRKSGMPVFLICDMLNVHFATIYRAIKRHELLKQLES